MAQVGEPGRRVVGPEVGHKLWRVFIYTYNNNNVLSETGAFILNNNFGGFTLYTLIHYFTTGAATLYIYQYFYIIIWLGLPHL